MIATHVKVLGLMMQNIIRAIIRLDIYYWKQNLRLTSIKKYEFKKAKSFGKYYNGNIKDCFQLVL